MSVRNSYFIGLMACAISILMLSNARAEQQGLIADDFESYAATTWPSPDWLANANAVSDPAQNRVEIDPTNSGNKVLKLHGSVGGCWAALAFQQCSFPEVFTLECDVYNVGGTLTGCHPYYGQIGMVQGANWPNPGRGLLVFGPENELMGGTTVLQTYETDRWYHVKIRYRRYGNNLDLCFWIDGVFKGREQITIQDLPKELSFDHIDLVAQEGTVYFDNVMLSEAEVPPYYVDGIDGNDLNDGLTPKTAFKTIQKGIDTTWDGDAVLVYPAVYAEELDALGKAITVKSADEPAVITAPDGYAISFVSGEDSNTVFEHFIIRGSDTALAFVGSSPRLNHFTVADNNLGAIADEFSVPAIDNSIFWKNTYGDLFGCEAVHSFVEQSVEDGMVGYWKFDETGGTTAYDESGYDNHGTVSNATRVSSMNSHLGNAYEFNGSNSLISVPDSASLQLSTLTISFWIKSRPNYWRVGVVGKDHAYVPDVGYNIRLIYDKPRLSLSYGPQAVGLRLTSDRNLADDVWHHVVGTYDGETGKIYIDGDLDVEEAYTEGFDNNNDELRFGNYPYPYSDGQGSLPNVLNGVLDEVMIFSRALSSNEVRQVYGNGVTPRFNDANNGDYHLKSERGRYWPAHDIWVLDKVTSPCVDAGDSMVKPEKEPMPNGARINQGAYGDTSQASMSEWPIAADLDRSGRVNMVDMALFAMDWLNGTDWVN